MTVKKIALEGCETSDGGAFSSGAENIDDNKTNVESNRESTIDVGLSSDVQQCSGITLQNASPRREHHHPFESNTSDKRKNSPSQTSQVDGEIRTEPTDNKRRRSNEEGETRYHAGATIFNHIEDQEDQSRLPRPPPLRQAHFYRQHSNYHLYDHHYSQHPSSSQQQHDRVQYQDGRYAQDDHRQYNHRQYNYRYDYHHYHQPIPPPTRPQEYYEAVRQQAMADDEDDADAQRFYQQKHPTSSFFRTVQPHYFQPHAPAHPSYSHQVASYPRENATYFQDPYHQTQVEPVNPYYDYRRSPPSVFDNCSFPAPNAMYSNGEIERTYPKQLSCNQRHSVNEETSHTSPGGASNNNATDQSSEVESICKSLYISQVDDENLPPYQVLIRKQLEVFTASEDYVGSYRRGRKKPIVLGQVGLQCRHCKMLPMGRRSKGAIYFPARLTFAYQAAQNMAKSHFLGDDKRSGNDHNNTNRNVNVSQDDTTCPYVSESIKNEMRKESRKKHYSAFNTGGKDYWASGLKALGVFDGEHGLVMQLSGNAETEKNSR